MAKLLKIWIEVRNAFTIDFQRKKTPVFCYGSNGIEQIRARCKNSKIQSRAAKLEKFVRIYAGEAPKWDGGGVASILEKDEEDCCVLGSVVDLSLKEIRRLDFFEGTFFGIYRRVETMAKIQKHGVPGNECLQDETCDVYIMNDPKYTVAPSEKYLTACARNIEQYWRDPTQPFSIDILDERGEKVSTWTKESKKLN